MDTVQTVGERQVRGDLGLRIEPSTLLLLVGDQHGNGENGEVNTESDSGGAGSKVGRRTDGDIGGGHELLHHIRTGGGDIEGEGKGTGGNLGGDDITLLVEDLVGGHVLTFPRSGVLHDLTKGLGVSKIRKGGRRVVGNGIKDDEIALSYKRYGCGINFVNNSSHILKSFF